MRRRGLIAASRRVRLIHGLAVFGGLAALAVAAVVLLAHAAASVTAVL